MSRIFAPLFISLVVAVGCQSSRSVRERDPDFWRGATAKDDDPELAFEAQKALARISFERARDQHTVAAYNSYLEAFPDGAQAAEVRSRLEALRFELAEKVNTLAAWEGFLGDHPNGERAPVARQRLAQLELARAKALGVDALQLFAARFPGSSESTEALAASDDLAMTDALNAGTRASFESYLARFSNGGHRAEAEQRVRVLELAEIEAAEDFEAAAAAARSWGGAAGTQARILAARLALRTATDRLDPRAMSAAATDLPASEAATARRDAAALSQHPPTGKVLALLGALAPDALGRDEAELIELMGSASDPRLRWLAAEELGVTGSLSAADPLLAAATEARHPLVRSRAGNAVLRLLRRTPQAAAQRFARARLAAWKANDLSHASALRMGLLEESLGLREAAIESYRRARRLDLVDPVPLEHLLRVSPSAPAVDRAVDARDLAAAVRDEAESADARDIGTARGLCARSHFLGVATKLLKAARGTGAGSMAAEIAEWTGSAERQASQVDAALADIEAALHAGNAAFRRCGDDDVSPRLREAQAAREAATKELARMKLDGAIRSAVERASERARRVAAAFSDW